MSIYFITILVAAVIYLSLENFKLNFKVGYYKQKLINRGVDISNVDAMGIIDIVKL